MGQFQYYPALAADALSIITTVALDQAKSKYTVDVHTSDVKGADFEGLAYITLTGWWGTSKEVRWREGGSGMNVFFRCLKHLPLEM